MNKELTFEDALKRLEDIVRELEEGDVNLVDMIKKYEEGSNLLKLCQTQLEQAEKKIKKLNADKSGNMTLEPFNQMNQE